MYLCILFQLWFPWEEKMRTFPVFIEIHVQRNTLTHMSPFRQNHQLYFYFSLYPIFARRCLQSPGRDQSTLFPSSPRAGAHKPASWDAPATSFTISANRRWNMRQLFQGILGNGFERGKLLHYEHHWEKRLFEINVVIAECDVFAFSGVLWYQRNLYGCWLSLERLCFPHHRCQLSRCSMLVLHQPARNNQRVMSLQAPWNGTTVISPWLLCFGISTLCIDSLYD